jgi:hypothetical protein
MTAGLVRKKFAYLGDDFLEISLRREYGTSKLRYLDPSGGERIPEFQKAKA